MQRTQIFLLVPLSLSVNLPALKPFYLLTSIRLIRFLSLFFLPSFMGIRDYKANSYSYPLDIVMCRRRRRPL